SATSVGFGRSGSDTGAGCTGWLSATFGTSRGPARTIHATTPSTIEIDAKTPPTSSSGLRDGGTEGVVLATSTARGLLGFSNGRCGILVRQVYGKQNRAASRQFGL